MPRCASYLPSGICGFACAAGCRRAAPPSKAAPPNVVIIFCDDLGYSDIGCFGAEGFETPNLDRLAREGRRFTSFYSAQAICSSSRAALLTGCYPNRIGVVGALNQKDRHGISDREMTIANVLKSRGYATAIFGKWHLGHHPRFLPTRHGFDEYFGLPYSNDMGPRDLPSGFPNVPLIEGEKVDREWARSVAAHPLVYRACGRFHRSEA